MKQNLFIATLLVKTAKIKEKKKKKATERSIYFMKRAILLTLVLSFLLCLCACSSEDPAPTQPDPALVAFCTGVFYTPQDECPLEDQIEFFSDGTCSVPEYTWTVVGNVLNLRVARGDSVQEVYGFSIDTETGIIQGLFDEHIFYYKG